MELSLLFPLSFAALFDDEDQDDFSGDDTSVDDLDFDSDEESSDEDDEFDEFGIPKDEQ